MPEKITGTFFPNFTPESFSPTTGVFLTPQVQFSTADASIWSKLKDPLQSWNACLALINSMASGPFVTQSGDETADPGNTFLSGAMTDEWGDGLLWLGPETMPLVEKNHIWTRDDIIAARNYRRKLIPEIIFKKIPRRWKQETLIDLLKPWFVYQNIFLFGRDAGVNLFSVAGFSDRPGRANGPAIDISITAMAIIDLEDEQGPFHYLQTTADPESPEALLARWNIEDMYEDDKEPLNRGKIAGTPIFPPNDTPDPSTGGTDNFIRYVLANGIDGIVEDVLVPQG